MSESTNEIRARNNPSLIVLIVVNRETNEPSEWQAKTARNSDDNPGQNLSNGPGFCKQTPNLWNCE